MSPKVFISYSHDSEEHKDRVLSFANRLREDGGIDCIIDQYEQSPPEGWSRWAINQIEEAEFVLVICTDQYSQLLEGKGEIIEGKATNWQGAIITQSISESQANTKFIPIVFSVQDSNYVPILLRSATVYTIDTNGYEELYRRLTDQHATPIPGLGEIKQLPSRFRQSLFWPDDTYSGLKEEFASASKGLLDWKRTLGNDDLQIPRPELDQLKHRITTDIDSTTIVLGVPGCGKSALY
jgi:SEFIR domain